jgi:hypothetical protein
MTDEKRLHARAVYHVNRPRRPVRWFLPGWLVAALALGLGVYGCERLARASEPEWLQDYREAQAREAAQRELERRLEALEARTPVLLPPTSEYLVPQVVTPRKDAMGE